MQPGKFAFVKLKFYAVYGCFHTRHFCISRPLEDTAAENPPPSRMSAAAPGVLGKSGTQNIFFKTAIA